MRRCGGGSGRLESRVLHPSIPFGVLFRVKSQTKTGERWKLHLFQSSLCRKARDGAFVVGKRKKVLDALSIVKIIIPTVTLMIHPSPPATSPRTTALLSPSPPASPFVPCVREYENPYNETILADGKRAPRAALATKTAQLCE
ncbi:hypothetical protein QQF64_033711 [Cirrhinus molitorella]|uniref:Uncharacterized protein n=1 Tax=Cirrhinus molitorella TaxID=172907 RepID=A0ABR3MUP5_9TELE